MNIWKLQPLWVFVWVMINLLNTLIFTDDLVLMVTAEDEVQLQLFKFKKVSERYRCKVSARKIKILAFKGK